MLSKVRRSRVVWYRESACLKDTRMRQRYNERRWPGPYGKEYIGFTHRYREGCTHV